MKKFAHHESKRLGTERSINHLKEMRAKLKKLIKRKKRLSELNFARNCNKDQKKVLFIL